ncbi:MAG: hypothetical protein WD751_05905 [Anaerolineales bacterium]
MDRKRKGKEAKGLRHFVTDVWRLAQVAAVGTVVYSLIAEVVNSASALVAGGVAGAAPNLGAMIIVEIPLENPLAGILIGCILLGILTYIGLKFLCSSEWVQEPVDVEECWTEITWNPFSWVEALVCTVVEVVKWVLKEICKWTEVFAIVLTVVCIVLAVLVLL